MVSILPKCIKSRKRFIKNKIHFGKAHMLGLKYELCIETVF